VGDDLENVAENRQRCFKAVGCKPDSLCDSWLVHGTDILIADAPRPPDMKYPPKADIILTDKPHVSLFMRYADCVPILLYDPVRHAVGLVHAGWMGTVKGVAAVAVNAMIVQYGSAPKDILAAIGPSICPQKYEIGPEVISLVRQAFGDEAGKLLPIYNGAVHFDLWAANRLVLGSTGVREIEVAGICTAGNLEDWFSHRAEKGRTGRFGALMALNRA
jgi:YfiH family protein